MIVSEEILREQHEMLNQQLMLNQIAQEELNNRQRNSFADQSSSGARRKPK